MKNLIIIILVSMLAVSCGPSKDEIQLETIKRQAFKESLPISDSAFAVERLNKAYYLTDDYYQVFNYQKNGHLFFGNIAPSTPKLGHDSRRNWLTHDPDCPKCQRTQIRQF